MRLLALCLAAAFATPALAQRARKPEPPPLPEAPVQRIDFTPGELEGGRVSPLGAIYTAKPKVRFPCLIKVRGNFSDRLDQSTDAL